MVISSAAEQRPDTTKVASAILASPTSLVSSVAERGLGKTVAQVRFLHEAPAVQAHPDEHIFRKDEAVGANPTCGSTVVSSASRAALS